MEILYRHREEQTYEIDLNRLKVVTRLKNICMIDIVFNHLWNLYIHIREPLNGAVALGHCTFSSTYEMLTHIKLHSWVWSNDEYP